MIKHTPGPWLIAEPKLVGPQQEGDRLIHTNGGLHIAEVIQYQGPNDNDGEGIDANASLIAAAPDLLEAAKAVVVDAAWPIGMGELQTLANTLVNVRGDKVRQLEAIIAKAEGGR